MKLGINLPSTLTTSTRDIPAESWLGSLWWCRIGESHGEACWTALSHERTYYAVLQVSTFEQLSNAEPGKAHTVALSRLRKNQKAKLQLTAETRLKKVQHTRNSHVWPRWVSIIGRVPQSSLLAFLPHCLLFTNIHFMPPCSKHKQKPWRAFSCCHRNSYYNLKHT